MRRVILIYAGPSALITSAFALFFWLVWGSTLQVTVIDGTSTEVVRFSRATCIAVTTGLALIVGSLVAWLIYAFRRDYSSTAAHHVPQPRANKSQ
jgi:hypothetical protein